MENFYLNASDLYMKYFGGYLGIDMVSFKMDKSICVYGKSMSGKTTLLRCIAGLEQYDGQIETNAKDIVFTFDISSLKKFKSVKQNIAYPLIIRNETNIDGKVLSIAKAFAIEDLLDKSISDLTISQKKLVVLARAFIRDADLYLLDDPLNGVENREKYFKVILDLIKDKTVIYTTSELKEAKCFDRIMLMAYKKCIGIGTIEELSSCPKTIDVMKLLYNYEYENLILNVKDDKYFVEINGITYSVPNPISDVYVGKEVVFLKDKKEILDMYFDKSTEYLISMR